MRISGDPCKFTLLRADTFLARLRGLMFKSSLGPNEALLLTRCNAIHTFFMRFDIDLVFLTRDRRVVRLCERVRPNRFGVICRGADSVLECPGGFIARNGITLHHVLEISPEARFVIPAADGGTTRDV